jgi:uncharacterized protein (DUF2235 family)
MSITRIVEGDLINTSTAMNLTANAGDYEFSAPMKNQWKGEADGVVESDYKASNKEDTLSNSINVNLNLFFDGTQNNKTNTEARNPSSSNHQAYIKTGNKNDDSFENDYTNVARGYDAVDPNAENQVAVYIEGIGTENLKSDSKFPGVAFGEGDTGVTAKVTKGCMDAAIEMRAKGYNNKDIDILFVNVYGFSRGATAARHFIHVASKIANYKNRGKTKTDKYKYYVNPDYFFNDSKYYFEVEDVNSVFLDKYGYFGACLLNYKMKIKEIRFNFVGLYDTVAAYGMEHRGTKILGISVVDNDTKQLNLDAIAKARYVFHLASEDEYRDNFDLTNIKSAGIRGFELMLPGVHSDIGGSYLNDVVELSVLDNIEVGGDYKEQTQTPEERAKTKKDAEYDSFKKIVIEEGWYNDKQLTKEFFYEKDFDKFASWYSNAYQYNYGLVGRRKLFNTYDKIPLKLMINESKRFDVVYTEKKVENNEIYDNFVNMIYNNVLQYFNTCANHRNKYVNEYNSSKQNFEELSKKYYTELKYYDCSSFILLEDIKKLRNEYLHWSVKSNLIGLSGRHKGALPQNQRKRENQDG